MRQHFLRLIPLALATWTPNLLTPAATRYGMALFHSITASGRTVSTVMAYLVAFVVIVTFGTLTKAVIFYAALGATKDQPVSITGSLKSGVRAFPKFWLISLVVETLTGIGLVLLVVPGAIFRTLSFVAPSCYVLEKTSLPDAIRRSATLTDGFRWQIFVILWVVSVGMFAISMIQRLMLGTHIPGTMTVSSMAFESASFIAKALLTAFQAILMVVIYHDLRQEKEGPDFDKIATVFD